MEILVPTAPGELIDKLTILRLKSEKMTDAAKLVNVCHEMAVLSQTATAAIPMSPALRALWDELYEINADLWVIEDDIRALRRSPTLAPDLLDWPVPFMLPTTNAPVLRRASTCFWDPRLWKRNHILNLGPHHDHRRPYQSRS